MEGHPNAAESSMPGPPGPGEVVEGEGSPTADPTGKDGLVVDQLSVLTEEALTLEEEVQQHLDTPPMNHSGLPGAGADEEREPLPTIGHRITSAEVPPSNAANSNIPSSEVNSETLVSSRVIWTPQVRPARQRSLEASSRVSLEVSDTSMCKSTRSNDPLFLAPFPGLGMPSRPLPNQTRTRQRSCNPAALAWRKFAAGGGGHCQ